MVSCADDLASAFVDELSRGVKPSEYKVDDTRVTLEITPSYTRPVLPDRDTLMCIIEGLSKLENTERGDPIEDHKVAYNYTCVQIVLEDRGTPTGRFLNDIAGWTLRGIAEWMTKNDCFREMSVGVYFNHYFCGVANVGKLGPVAVA